MEHPVWSRSEDWFVTAGEQLASAWCETSDGELVEPVLLSGGGHGPLDCLGPMREALAADGYRLSPTLVGGVLDLRISPDGDACGECLVPADVLAAMARQWIADGGHAIPDLIRVSTSAASVDS